MEIFDNMKRFLSALTVIVAVIIASGCTKDARRISVERQWAGIVDNGDGLDMNFCIDLGVTSEGNMIVAIKAGDFLETLGGFGDIDLGDDFGDIDLGEWGNLLKLLGSLDADDYIYTDKTTMAYKLTYTGKDTGNITFMEPGIGGGEITVDFKKLDKSSVTITIDNEELTLTAKDMQLKKIDDIIFKFLF